MIREEQASGGLPRGCTPQQHPVGFPARQAVLGSVVPCGWHLLSLRDQHTRRSLLDARNSRNLRDCK